MIELYHTSPKEIKEISDDGLFGEYLCFSADIYTMSEAECPIVYTTEIDEAELIEASALYYEDISEQVEEVVRVIGCDEDTALDILSERDTAWNHGGDAEDDWFVQRMTAEAAGALGYKGVIGRDEQGAVYLLNAKKIELNR